MSKLSKLSPLVLVLLALVAAYYLWPVVKAKLAKGGA